MSNVVSGNSPLHCLYVAAACYTSHKLVISYLCSLEREDVMENRASTPVFIQIWWKVNTAGGWYLCFIWIEVTTPNTCTSETNLKSKRMQNERLLSIQLCLKKKKPASQTSSKHLLDSWQWDSFAKGSCCLRADEMKWASCSVTVLHWKMQPPARAAVCVPM